MNSNNRFAVRGVRLSIAASLLAAASLFAGALFASEAEPTPPKTYPTAEAAVEALVAAARSDDRGALMTVLGESSEPLVSSGDDVADANARTRFVSQYDEAHELVADGENKFSLEVGDDDWPFPFPIVKVGDQWAFDVDAGIDEVVYRRIGHNELGAIEACRGIVDAQKEYASESHDGLPAGTFAQKLMSDEGKHNGLYWPSQPDERASPVGPFIATAAAEGYRKDAKEGPQPYHGYVYRLLTAQGAAAPGGARSYLKDGQSERRICSGCVSGRVRTERRANVHDQSGRRAVSEGPRAEDRRVGACDQDVQPRLELVQSRLTNSQRGGETDDVAANCCMRGT